MSDTTDSPITTGFNRRSFIAGAAGSAVLPLTARADTPATDRAVQDPSHPVDVTLRVNGETRHLKLDPRTTVLDALREHVLGGDDGLRPDQAASVQGADAGRKPDRQGQETVRRAVSSWAA